MPVKITVHESAPTAITEKDMVVGVVYRREQNPDQLYVRVHRWGNRGERSILCLKGNYPGDYFASIAGGSAMVIPTDLRATVEFGPDTPGTPGKPSTNC